MTGKWIKNQCVIEILRIITTTDCQHSGIFTCYDCKHHMYNEECRDDQLFELKKEEEDI
jgi:hypothetical protein